MTFGLWQYCTHKETATPARDFGCLFLLKIYISLSHASPLPHLQPLIVPYWNKTFLIPFCGYGTRSRATVSLPSLNETVFIEP